MYIMWCIRGIYCQLAANFASWKFPIAAHQFPLLEWHQNSDMLVLAEIFWGAKII